MSPLLAASPPGRWATLPLAFRLARSPVVPIGVDRAGTRCEPAGRPREPLVQRDGRLPAEQLARASRIAQQDHHLAALGTDALLVLDDGHVDLERLAGPLDEL